MAETASVSPADLPVDEDSARADVYALLGALLAKPPDTAFLAQLQQIPVTNPADDNTLAAAWATLKIAAARAHAAPLNEEYHDLFIGLGRGELVPYGSWYVTGFLMEKPLAELRIDLQRLGLERQEAVHEPEDHAAALCETMSLLVLSREHVPFAQQRAFFERHLAPWMGRFFGDLASAEAARFYRAVGVLGERFFEVEREYFAMLA